MTKQSEQDKFNEFLLAELESTLFSTGAPLVSALVKKFNISEEYARKILTRAVSGRGIASSKPYTFGKKQFLYMVPGYHLQYEDVLKVCQETRPPMARLLESILQDEIISYYEALKITASPDETSSAKVSRLDDMIKLLRAMNFIDECVDDNSVRYIVRKYKTEENEKASLNLLMKEHYVNMQADSWFMQDIMRWMSRVHLIDNGTSQYRRRDIPSRGVKNSGLYWDAVGYSSTTGIGRPKGAAPSEDAKTIVVFDVVLSMQYQQRHIDAFLDRVQLLINGVKEGKRKILPIVVYTACEEHQLNRMKKLGFLAFDLASIFGKHVTAILADLKQINLSLIERPDAAIDTSANISRVLEIIKDAGQEDSLRALKGAIFEIMMYPLLKSIFPNSNFKRGKTIKSEDGKNYEYDYLIDASNPEEYVVVELKGYASDAIIEEGDMNTKNTLSWFFRRTAPFAEKQRSGEAKSKPFRTVFITSALISDGANAFIANMNRGKNKPTNLNCTYDRNELLELLKRYDLNQEVKIINNFFGKSKP